VKAEGPDIAVLKLFSADQRAAVEGSMPLTC